MISFVSTLTLYTWPVERPRLVPQLMKLIHLLSGDQLISPAWPSWLARRLADPKPFEISMIQIWVDPGSFFWKYWKTNRRPSGETLGSISPMGPKVSCFIPTGVLHLCPLDRDTATCRD